MDNKEPIRLRFINYPEPLESPRDGKPTEHAQDNFVLSGIGLVLAAWAMEFFGFLRRIIWLNTGFNRPSRIGARLLDFEPRYDPTVIPLASEEVNKGKVASDAPSTPELPLVKSGYYSAADYHRLYLSGELTPMAVVRAILPLVDRESSPPGKHSTAWFAIKAERILAAAEASTKRYAEGKPLGPLDGVPAAVKDEYDLDGYTTCLGSPNDYTEPVVNGITPTSWCAEKLQETGAIIIGKTSMHEFGLDTTGNNPHYGTPLNPYNDKYYTGGSSSGSSYAVSAGLVPMSMGSDGGGSIRIPSSYCGVYGIKPTHTRISFRPGPNHAITCAVNGPIAADMASLTALFSVVSVPHPGSSFSPMAPFTLYPATPDAKILGVDAEWNAYADPANQKLCEAMIARLVAEKGYRVVSIQIPHLTEGQLAHALTVLTDAATLLPNTRGLSAANRILLALGRTSSAVDYLMAQKLRGLLMQHLAHVWQKYPGMIIASPVTACAGWPIRDPVELKHGINDGGMTLKSMRYVWLANFCGTPAISLPAGYAVPHGREGAGDVWEPGMEGEGRVPIGFMGMGEWGSEHQLLRFGFEVEALFVDRVRASNWEDIVARAKGRN